MLEIIGAALQLIIMLLTKWFQFTDEKKATAQEILKDVNDAKDVSSIVNLFDRINRL